MDEKAAALLFFPHFSHFSFSPYTLLSLSLSLSLQLILEEQFLTTRKVISGLKDDERKDPITLCVCNRKEEWFRYYNTTDTRHIMTREKEREREEQTADALVCHSDTRSPFH